MKKIDKNLLSFMSLSQRDCVLECIVYYYNKNKALKFFNERNIKVIRDLYFINAFSVCFNSYNLFTTARQSFIAYISSISYAKSLIFTSKKIINSNTCSLTGKGIGIAFIDTGINSHLDFCLCKNRILSFVDFVNNFDKNYDDNGHGTFVCSVACGSGIYSHKKYSGIAPCSNIVSLKALNEKGEANAVTILEAMQWIYEHYREFNIKVVCMSFGSEPLGKNDPIMYGAEKLWDIGITVVCAGGNSGPNFQTIKSPGISKKIITVGGIDDCRDSLGNYDINNFKIADFSSRGPAFNKIKPDIVAPSVNITGCSHKGGYTTMSGTSVATPMVAGLCALIYQKYDNAKPNQIKQYLLNNAISIGYNKYAQGYGLVHFDEFKL